MSNIQKLLGALNLLGALATAVLPSPSHAEPTLAEYYTNITPRVIDGSFSSSSIDYKFVDLNGDGNQDIIMLGAIYPLNGLTTYSPQPGRIFWGDGRGGFTLASQSQFPLDTLNTVHPRKILVGDLNGDGMPDLFISSHGWDAPPGPGEQNRLYLSKPNGTWIDATANLPQLSDYSHTSAIGDINGDGKLDIFVGNGYSAQNGILPYFLMNQGAGVFVLDRSNIPVLNNQSLDINSGYQFPGASLADMDGDGLPELVVTADASSSFSKHRNTTIYWNNIGSFSDANSTILPATKSYPTSHIDLDVQAIDVNRDGLLDLIVVGTQGQPAYDGWFVQVLINKGNHQFVDETLNRMSSGDIADGIPGQSTGAAWAMWVQNIDFNNDGYPDFAVTFKGAEAKQSQPLIWINDGTGYFTTLKTKDFVNIGNEWMIGLGEIASTQNGYSFLTNQFYPGSGGLRLTGLLAVKPYQKSSAFLLPDCLFNYAEEKFPTLFSTHGTSASFNQYYYRFYPKNNSYLGISKDNNHYYYLVNDPMEDVGIASELYRVAGCQ